MRKAALVGVEGEWGRTGSVEELVAALFTCKLKPATEYECVAPSNPVSIPPNVEALRHGMQYVIKLIPLVFADFVFIDPSVAAPNGFLMGSPSTEKGRSEDETQHTVILTKPYWLQKTPTTQQQWQAVMGSNPSRRKRLPKHPVHNVSWNDCQQFIAKLRSGKLAARLPTEAEWELACRAGTTTPFSCGASISTRQANFDGRYMYGNSERGKNRESTKSVGSFAPNPWGLTDMHGNVWEWCQDFYGAFDEKTSRDPLGNSSGSNRVLRGGSWTSHPQVLRSAFRHSRPPDCSFYDIGLRLCLDSPFAL